jgi:hypothetical protein
MYVTLAQHPSRAIVALIYDDDGTPIAAVHPRTTADRGLRLDVDPRLANAVCLVTLFDRDGSDRHQDHAWLDRDGNPLARRTKGDLWRDDASFAWLIDMAVEVGLDLTESIRDARQPPPDLPDEGREGHQYRPGGP